MNPTGSFKDRGMTMAVTKGGGGRLPAPFCALQHRQHQRGGGGVCGARGPVLHCAFARTPTLRSANSRQAMIHGAKIVAVLRVTLTTLCIWRATSRASFPSRWSTISTRTALKGQKTAAFEVCDALGDAPDFHALPVGNAGNITAYWKGYKEYQSGRQVKQIAAACSVFKRGARPPSWTARRLPIRRRWQPPSALAIRRRGSTRCLHRDESGGLIDKVTDDEILDAYRQVASLRGRVL